MTRLITAIGTGMFEQSAVGLERQLARRTGIAHVDVDQAAHTVTVEFDDARVKPAEVHRLIAECGYHGYIDETASG